MVNKKAPTSKKKAQAGLRSLIKRAEKGEPDAQHNLGLTIMIGQGTEKDLETGVWWLEQAAANGYELSAHVLSIIYREGMYGMKASRSKAAYWNKRAGPFKDRS